MTIKGESVTVELRNTSTATDAFNAQAVEYDASQTVDAIVAPGNTSDIFDDTRTNGKIIDYTLHFPKTFEDDLTGARITLRGVQYAVVGVPMRYTADNTPGDYNVAVAIHRVEG